MTAVEIVLGPPGTGKTTELLNMVDEELRRGVPPEKVGYVSFTRRAADEAVQRAQTKFGFKRDQLPYFRTLHSLCFARLGLNRKDVLSGDKLQQFADWCGIKLTGRVMEDGTLVGDSPGDRAMQIVNLSRIRRVSLRQAYMDLHDDQDFVQIEHVERSLRSYKQEHGLLDYTDMLERFVDSDLPSRLSSLFVDEGQDLSRLQWDVVDKLWREAERRVVAGDDDQAIYRWAGADVEHLIKMPGAVRVLRQSHRVPRAVQQVANRIIDKLHVRRPKEWTARDTDGAVQRVRKLEHISLNTDETTLILARNLYLLREVVFPTLRNAAILYEHDGRPSISDKLLSAVYNWENLRRGAAVTAGEARVIYEYLSVGVGFKRGHKLLPAWPDDEMIVGMGDLQRNGGLLVNSEWFTALDKVARADVAYIGKIRRRGEQKLRERPTVRVSTIHGSKGGEADHVVLLTDMAFRTWTEMRVDAAAEDDERRVWYVAVTRTKQRLTIVEPQGHKHCPWL